jgi:hypothetical protein
VHIVYDTPADPLNAKYMIEQLSLRTGPEDGKQTPKYVVLDRTIHLLVVILFWLESNYYHLSSALTLAKMFYYERLFLVQV